MGQEVEQRKFTRQDRHRFRQKVQDCLDALAEMLAERTFDVGEPQIGMEVELNLIDAEMAPSMANAAVLDAIADPDYQTELGQFNIEINVAPRPLHGRSMADLEHDLRRSLNAANERARTSGSRIVMIGMLPTLAEKHFEHRWLSASPRYDLLNQQIFAPACGFPGPLPRRNSRPSPTPFSPRRRARPFNSICRSTPTSSPPIGTQPRQLQECR